LNELQFSAVTHGFGTVALAVGALLTCSPAHAQLAGGALVGTARDESGRPLANVAIEIVERSTSRVRTVTTADDGAFCVRGRRAG
jgi:hypothetical protein